MKFVSIRFQRTNIKVYFTGEEYISEASINAHTRFSNDGLRMAPGLVINSFTEFNDVRFVGSGIVSDPLWDSCE